MSRERKEMFVGLIEWSRLIPKFPPGSMSSLEENDWPRIGMQLLDILANHDS